MKKKLSILLALLLAAALFTACGSSGENQQSEEKETAKTDIIVFAASSMTETLTELGDAYMDENEDINLIFNFDSSGTLKTQIQEGADCDIFISAGQKQMNELDINADPEINTEGLDYVLDGTRKNILENQVTLCVADNSKAGIDSFDSMAEKLSKGEAVLAMGNSDVPVGQYTQKILDFYNISEKDLADKGAITYGSNVKEVTTQVTEGTVDCGIIYCTDAYSAGITPIAYATKEMCGQVIYPIALINTTKHETEAQSFVDYLFTDKALDSFTKVGFKKIEE